MPGPFSARGPSVIAQPEGPAAIRLDPCKRWPQKGPKRRPPRAIVRTVRKTDEAPQGQALAQTRRQPSIAGAAGRYIRRPALPHGDRRRMPEGSDGRGGLRPARGPRGRSTPWLHPFHTPCQWHCAPGRRPRRPRLPWPSFSLVSIFFTPGPMGIPPVSPRPNGSGGASRIEFSCNLFCRNDLLAHPTRFLPLPAGSPTEPPGGPNIRVSVFFTPGGDRLDGSLAVRVSGAGVGRGR